MATEVIHEHTAPARDSSGIGFILGVALLVILAIFALYYLGIFGRSGLFGSGTPQINVPSQMDVNVNRK